MRTVQQSKKMALTGFLGFAVAACSGSGEKADGSGGTSTNPQGGYSTNNTANPPSSGGVTNHSTGGAPGTTTGHPTTGGTTNISGSSISNTGGASTVSTGGAVPTGGTGGKITGGAGGKNTGGTGGKNTGGSSSPAGGTTNAGGSALGGNASGGSTGSKGGSGSTVTGTCTASKAAGSNVSGSGPHKVTVETNSDSGINEGTIFRPTDLGGVEKYPIFVWGEGGCSQNGLSNSVAMGEIASHGYFVIADGTPNNNASRAMDSSNPAAMGKPLRAYIDWAIAENEKPCSVYYHSIDTTKIAANGFSCGGLMAEGTAGDPRMTTWGLNSSGLFAVNRAFYKTIHTPVLLVEGGTSDMAYVNGSRDYDNISALGIPIMFFSKNIGHGGDLFTTRGGDFTKINLAWLNWWLKGDETATGKGVLVGSSCTYCTNSAWEVKSKNLP
jgi:hypothetical protein